jgi:hypothetical protein
MNNSQSGSQHVDYKPLYQWILEQPPEVQEILVEQLFSNEILNISDMIEFINRGELTPNEDNGPTIGSILFHGSIIKQLEDVSDASDWTPNGIYHYENTIGIITDTGLWEIEVVPEAWSKHATGAFRLQLYRDNVCHDVCVQTCSNPSELPIGDRLAAIVLACWNDAETAKRVSTFADAMGLSRYPPILPPVICPNCRQINNNYRLDGGHSTCECQRIYECPTCDRMAFTEHEQCNSCIHEYV